MRDLIVPGLRELGFSGGYTRGFQVAHGDYTRADDNGRGDASLGLDEIAWVFRPTGQQADEWFAMLADEGEAGRLDALRMITEEAADDPRCRVVLSDRLARDPSPRVREDAAGALASRGREATVRRALQDAADQDEDLQVRWAARCAIRLAAST